MLKKEINENIRCDKVFRESNFRGKNLIVDVEFNGLKFNSWQHTVKMILTAAFDNEINSNAFSNAKSADVWRMGMNQHQIDHHHKNDVLAKIAIIDSCLAQLKMGLGKQNL